MIRRFLTCRFFLQVLIPVLIALSIMGCSRDGFRVTFIYCENRVDPAGVSTTGIRFSWKLASPERDVLQSGYRLLLAAEMPGSFDEEDLIWDSGIITSEQSILVPYGGPALKPGSGYLWKVKVWDNLGNESYLESQRTFCYGN